MFILQGCANKNTDAKHDVAISSDGERIAYNMYGAGETSLIFIHGWSCDSRYWQKQIPVFSKDYQVITLDLAGHGNSSLNRTDYTMLSFANDVRAVIAKENIHNAILIGHSMGGPVIAEAAKLMPEEIDGIIAIDTLQNVAEIMPQNVIDKMTAPFEADFSTAMQGFAVSMFPKGANQELVAWVKEDVSSAPKDVALSAWYNMLKNNMGDIANAAQVFEDVHVPVISINARLWPTNEDENRKHIKNYTLFYIEETGHFPMLEAPETFNALLLEAINLIGAEKAK